MPQISRCINVAGVQTLPRFTSMTLVERHFGISPDWGLNNVTAGPKVCIHTINKGTATSKYQVEKLRRTYNGNSEAATHSYPCFICKSAKIPQCSITCFRNQFPTCGQCGSKVQAVDFAVRKALDPELSQQWLFPFGWRAYKQ